MILNPPRLVHKTKEAAVRADLRELEDIYPREYEVGSDMLEEMVEKMVILTHLFSREF